jgi:hypothetical protein
MSFHHVASVDFCDLSVGSHTMSTALYRIHPSTIMNMPYLSGRSVMLHPLPYTSDEISLAAYAVYAPRGCGVDRLSMSIHVPEDSNMTAGLLVKKAAQQRIYATSCQASFLLQNRPGSSSWKNHRSAWGIDMMKQYKSNAVDLQGPTVCTSSPHWNKMSLTLWLSFTGAPKLA